jgi:hypothetical protein
MIDQYAAHHSRGHSEEMSAVLPGEIRARKAQVSFMHEHRGWKRVAWTLAG